MWFYDNEGRQWNRNQILWWKLTSEDPLKIEICFVNYASLTLEGNAATYFYRNNVNQQP